MTSPDLGAERVGPLRKAPHDRSASGYSHPAYADSLTEFGRPRFLPACGGWVLERAIPGAAARDAMCCYPIFSCRDWTSLPSDLEALDDDLVSLVMVTDPFGNYSETLLASAFPDLVLRFKEHFVTDLQPGPNSFVTSHHQYYARKALEKVTVTRCHDPLEALDEWSDLYAALVARHQLSGIKAFSRSVFATQLGVPGMVMLRAQHEGETVGAHLWYEEGEVAYSHLTASSPSGYELMAAYALSWRALEYFAGKVRWLDWGAGAGLTASESDGLSRFKRGWANDRRAAYLCGRVCDRLRYDKLAAAKGDASRAYFPAYRIDELS
ncbi:MAG: GNAT family N-acetyltransferase [Chthoniobacterales bacterium]|nr:GNAT family N-acetyltransferase [Chthoniobacterales bacterium]